MRIPLLISVVLLALATSLTSYAAGPIKSVTGEYTYYGNPDDSPADCKRKAAQYARIEALKEFGTIVSQNTLQSDYDTGDSAQSSFLSISETEVKGEWLGDEGEPQYTTNISDDGTIVVTCKIKGRARAISNEASDFDALVLRNGTDRKNADTNFRDGDDMYLYFSAPSNGFVSVFLQDESGEAFCLLPYARSSVTEAKVKRGYDYIFFDSKRSGNEFGNVEELTLTAPRHREYNKVYVIFSPNSFAMAPVHFTVEGAPPSINGEDFSKWLVRNRRNDPKMGVKQMVISIDPSGSQTERIRH